jgi:hypothetical protein
MIPLKICAVIVVAIVLAMGIAHVLELPGKLRLPKEQYLAVQAIYYPGFTYAGATEPLGVILTALLAFLMPAGSSSFWLTVTSCLALALMHAIYWVSIHPINNFWLKDISLQGAGGAFFGFGSKPTRTGQVDWTYLRGRWEYSHLARAGLAVVAFVLLVIAVIG